MSNVTMPTGARPGRSLRAALPFGASMIATPSWFGQIPAHALLMSMLFGAAIVIAAMLLPGDSERIAMLERDGKTREARQILEVAFASGDRRQQSLFQLQGLYEASGDIERARETLEALAALRPRDYAVQRQLSVFYRNIQDEPAHIRSLLALIDLRYAEAPCREVIGILRRRGDYVEEQAALSKCRQKGYRRADDMIRLGALMASGGETRDAATLLKAVDDLRRLSTDQERLQLFDLMLEIGQARDAQRRAIRWVKATRDDALALSFIRSLATIKRHDLAIELARETSVPGDAVFLSIAEMMADQSLNTAAQDLLRGWLDKAIVSDDDVLARFVGAALDAAAPRIAYTGVRKFGVARLSHDQGVILADSLDAAGHLDDASWIRTALQIEQRPAPPLLASINAKTSRVGKSEPVKLDRLAAWRADLWKRLQRENRGVRSLTGERQKTAAATLKTVKRARKLRVLTRRFKARPIEPVDANP